jgi:Cu-Zn family superoxide dismutase
MGRNYDMKRILSWSFVSFALLMLAAPLARAQLQNEKPKSPVKAIVVLHPTEGNQVSGTVIFTEAAGGVRVEANLTGLSAGKHGFHVHEFGDCSAADGSSAGGHFNPTHQPHAGPTAEHRHTGDMGNIEADASGAAKLDYVDHSLSLGPGERSIIGRALIVHVKADDLKTPPTGDAGARVACGVIGWAQTK